MTRALARLAGDRIGLLGIVDVPIVDDTWDEIEDVVSSVWDRIPGSEIIDDVTKTIEDVVRWWWDSFKYVNIWVGPYVWFGETGYKIANDINDGKNVGRAIRENLSDQGKEYARSLQRSAPYIAMVPGIGTGIAIAMNSAAALALAQPLDQIALDAAALSVPGGPVAQQAFSTGTRLGAGMLAGESFDEIAAREARAALVRQIGEPGAVAFDAGLALARGKSLQDAGFQALYYYTKGNELVDRAAHFAEAVAKGAREGKSVGQILAQETTKGLSQLGGSFVDRSTQVEDLAKRILQRGEVDELGKALVETQDYGNALQALANRYSVPPDVVRAAMSTITWEKIPTSAGTVVVPRFDEGKMQEIDPIRKNIRTPVAKAIRNTNLIRPITPNLRMPPWLAQPEASIAAYEPPRVEPPPIGQALPSQAPSRFVTRFIAPALLTAPLWAPLALPWIAKFFRR